MKYSLDGVDMPTAGLTVSFNPEDIKKQKRTADGTLKTELIGVKRNYSMSYQWLRLADFNKLKNSKALGKNLILNYIDDDGSAVNVTVWMSQIKYVEKKEYDNDRVYKSIKFTLEEV